MNGRRNSRPPTAGRRVAGSGTRVAAVAAGVVLLSACGGAGQPAAPPADPSLGVVTTAADGVQEVTLQMQDDYEITPDAFEVAPGRVRLTVDNVAERMTHNFRFTPDGGPEAIEEEISLLAAGERRTVEFDVAAPGEYRFECTFHIQFDQVGTMTVRG